MKIRFGYVANNVALNLSPSRTVAVSNLQKIESQAHRLEKLRKIVKGNLDTTLLILKYNASMGISLYRFSSRLVPLSTHPIVDGWDYLNEFRHEFKQIGDFVKENGLQVGFHPDQFTVINSPEKKVVEAAVKDLYYHAEMIKVMGLLGSATIVLHIGGVYGEKDQAMERFKHSFKLLNSDIRQSLVLENDDRSYTAKNVLEICEDLGVPIVLDYHHHICHNQGEDLQTYMPRIFGTWKDRRPKVHLSSPKDEKNYRSHADDIRLADFADLLKQVGAAKCDFDIMIEAKNKDIALMRFFEEVKTLPEVKVVKGYSVEV